MSLATSGGIGGAGGHGGGAGGIVMAHQANAVGQGAPPQPPPQAKTTTGAPPPPPSASLLGADLLDKNQNLSLKSVRNTSHLPIVGVDLHGGNNNNGLLSVAYFPKKPDDPSKGALPFAVTAEKIKNDISLRSGEAAHKTLRKYLSKSKTYNSLKTDSLSENPKSAVVIHKPHRWLGFRRIQDAPEFLKDGGMMDTDEETSGPAIAEEAHVGVGVTVANDTIDGSSPPTGDDYDRVVFKVRLHESKKAIGILPEEAVEIMFRQAQYATARKLLNNNVDVADDEEEEIDDYPIAVAIPAWACHDAAVEALLDATGSGGTIFHRNVAALAGALLPSIDGRLTPVLDRLNKVRTALHKQHQKHLMEDPGAIFEDDVLLIIFGMTCDGMEATAIQVSSANPSNIACLFGVFKVISNVSYQNPDPLSKMEACAQELEKNVDTLAPEADGPGGILFCGSVSDQKAMMNRWNKIKNEEWKKVPVLNTDADCIAKGTAVLGALSHGRLSKMVPGSHGKTKSRVELGIKVQNVAPAAVGVQMNYHGGAASKWKPVKTIFDFDRQIPAGPHAFEFNAAELAVYRSGEAEGMSDEEFEKATKKNEGAKGIPLREEAALNYQIRILQKWTRDAEWKMVGDVIEPLVKTEETKDGEETRVACESVTFELSLGLTGMLTTSLVGERQSVVLANASARKSAMWYYFWVVFAILFFGGFLTKSYWDDYVLKRDTKRLLAFYKQNVPGSHHDGDEMQARWTCYKFRNKKAKLWRNLEKKYGVPVLSAEEYEAMFAEAESESEDQPEPQDEENLDLDDEEEESAKQEAPDL